MSLSPTQDTTLMETHRQVIQRIVDELFNQDRYDIIDELYNDELRNHDKSLPNQPDSKQELVKLLQFHRRAFPDLKYSLQTVLCEGDMTAFRWTVNGTHTGPLGDVAPTGNPFKVEGMSFAKFVDGKISVIWQLHDTEAIYTQLGLPPIAIAVKD